MIYLTGISIIFLIFANAITDAPNAISTVVGTKVLSFRKAAYLSAVFNFIGIICMCFINFSVAKNMAGLINFETQKEGIFSIFSAVFSTVIFAFIALKFGIPTSETHSLIASLTGACVAFGKYNEINIHEWKKVLIGLFWSIFFTYIFTKIINMILGKYLNKIKLKKIKAYQIFSCFILSFMHGAQDGLKFIGVFILYFCSIKNQIVGETLNPANYFWIIVFVASIMSIGVGIGGRSIVENIGFNLGTLSNTSAIITDISTGITLFIASVFGIPISTSHCKTVSIISVSKNPDSKVINQIINAWVITFPVCFMLSFVTIKIIY